MYDIPTEPPTGEKPLSNNPKENKPLHDLTDSEIAAIKLLSDISNDRILVGCARVLINYIVENYSASGDKSSAIKHILFAIEDCSRADKNDT